MKNPPILIAIIGFFAALAGFGYLFFGLRVIGFDWFGALGDLPAFEHVGLWGWLAVATGIVWILAALGLWALQPWARLFAHDHRGLRPVRGGSRLLPVPRDGRRLRDGAHAGGDPLVPELRRGQGGVRLKASQSRPRHAPTAAPAARRRRPVSVAAAAGGRGGRWRPS